MSEWYVRIADRVKSDDLLDPNLSLDAKREQRCGFAIRKEILF